MSDGPADPAAMTKAQASVRFNKLKAMTECIQNEDEFYALYMGTARNLLAAYPIPTSSGTTPAVLPDASEVCGTLADMLPAPSAVFTEDYYSRPTYPIKVLFTIAEFYGFSDVEAPFRARLALSDYERSHKGIMNQMWFAYVLGLDPSSTRSVMDKFKNARSILTHRPPGAPVAPTATATAAMAEPASSASHARLGAQSASGPVPGSTGFLAGSAAARGAPPSPTPAPGPFGFQAMPESPFRAERPSDAGTLFPPSQGFPGQPFGAPGTFEDTRKATYVHQHFTSTKFTGDMSQSIVMHLRDYETCARQHRLSPAQKADYLVNSLEGPARNFLLSNFTPGMRFEEAAEVMKREYDSDSRQLQVQSSLEGLKLGSFMSSQTISTESEGLNKIVEHIERLTPQCPVGFRSDENKIRYLRSAVLGYEWALTPIRSIVTHGYKFHGFVTALHESLQLSEELKTRASSSFQTQNIEMEEEEAAESFFQRYGRHPRDVRKYNPRNRTSFSSRGSSQPRGRASSRTFDEARRRNECFKCGADWKPGHRCKSGAITENARSRLRKGDSHIHLVRDLLLGLESEAQTAGDDGNPATEGDAPAGDSYITEHADHPVADALAPPADGAPHHASLADALDAELTTNMLSAAMGTNASASDFQ